MVFLFRQIFMGGSDAEPLRLEVDANDGTITAWINISYHDSVRTYLEARAEDAKAESRFAAAHHTFKNGLSQVRLILILTSSVCSVCVRRSSWLWGLEESLSSQG